MKRLIISAAIALALAGCASTEVMEYRAAPGQEIRMGNGGAVKGVNGMDVWLNGGTPPRAFRILAETTTSYQTGLADVEWKRQSAFEQIVAEAKKRGADAVVVYGQVGGNAGSVYVPGVTTTTVTGYGSGARVNSYTSPGFSSAVGAQTVGAWLVKYEN
jgi:uncharacterized protein YbjQ (UPF0145 family)